VHAVEGLSGRPYTMAFSNIKAVIARSVTSGAMAATRYGAQLAKTPA